MFTPELGGLLSIIYRISSEAKNGALVSIESTVPKGTSKRIFDKLNHRLHVVHAPHRWYALEEKEHGVNQLRVIGEYANAVSKQACNSIVVALPILIPLTLIIPCPIRILNAANTNLITEIVTMVQILILTTVWEFLCILYLT